LAFGITGGQTVFVLKAAGQTVNHEQQWLGIGVRKKGMEGAMQVVRFRALVGEEEELSHSPAEQRRASMRPRQGSANGGASSPPITSAKPSLVRIFPPTGTSYSSKTAISTLASHSAVK
jgi:hypothetical protein